MLPKKIYVEQNLIQKNFGARNIWGKRNFVKKNTATMHKFGGSKKIVIVWLKIRFVLIFGSIFG